MVKREGSPSTASSQPATKKKSSGAIKEKKKLVSSVSKLSTPNNCKESHPTWSEELPQGEYGKQCVEKWCLLAPYDNSITDKQWRSYFLERSELDHIHTSLTPAFERIERDELGNTSTVLRSMASAISGEIYGSAIKDEEEKTRLGRTSRGSIYLLKLAGVNDGTTPQTLEVQSRLYSPYGIGTSIDFAYYFHHLPQTEPVDFNTWLLASPRSIADSQPSRATESSALRKNGSGAPTDSAIKIFRCVSPLHSFSRRPFALSLSFPHPKPHSCFPFFQFSRAPPNPSPRP
ncbi:hypothetical protein BDY24DRAFT_122963 [Mrakia frigida]|uniref:uncharacterized protein n=1 Tax=Mrakia frigida TaxID=29902 RepID=UPI003FCC1814